MKLLSLLKTQEITLSKYTDKDKKYILKKLDTNKYFVCLLTDKRFKIDISSIDDSKVYNNNVIDIKSPDNKQLIKYIESHFELIQNLINFSFNLDKLDAIINIKEVYNFTKL